VLLKTITLMVAVWFFVTMAIGCAVKTYLETESLVSSVGMFVFMFIAAVLWTQDLLKWLEKAT
jgi:hypothetical protein